MSSVPGSGRSPGVRNGNLLQYSCLENHGQRNLAGYNPWRRKESDMTEHTHTHTHTQQTFTFSKADVCVYLLILTLCLHIKTAK